MADFLKIEDFQPHVGKIVSFVGTPFAFPLDRIMSKHQQIPYGSSRIPFTLIFVGPKSPRYLPEGQYDCAIADGPTFSGIHVNPIHTPEPDRQEYQAVFN